MYVGGGAACPSLFARSPILPLGLFSDSSPLFRVLSSPVVSPLAHFSSCFFFRRSPIPWQPLVLPWSLECLELQAPHFSWSRRVRSLFDIFLLFLLLSIFWRRSSISWISEGPSSSILRSITARRVVSLLFSAVKREASSFRNDLFSTSNVAIRPSIIAKAPGAGSILAPAVMDLAASLSIFTCVPLRLRDVSATLVTSEARRISSVLIFSARSVGSSGDPPVLLFFARGASTAGVSSSSLVSSVRRFPAFAVARKRVNGSRKFPLRL